MPNRPFPGGFRKAVPPPAPTPKKTNETRATRLGLDTFVYDCFQCGEQHTISSGYLFVVILNGDWLYFCNANCCDAWEIANPELKGLTPPVPDRRGAVLATREKNKTDSSTDTFCSGCDDWHDGPRCY